MLNVTYSIDNDIPNVWLSVFGQSEICVLSLKRNLTLGIFGKC